MAVASTVMMKTQIFLAVGEGEGGAYRGGFGGGGGYRLESELPGGGGGYSGGSGGANKNISCGGGGGSFNNGTNRHNECCYKTAGHGKVIITFLH